MTGILCIILFSIQAYGQISVGGNISYLNVFGGTGLKNIGVGFKGDYAMDERTVFSGGLNYFLPSKYSSSNYGTSYSSQTSPNQIDINVDYKISFIQLYIGGRRYFAGDYEDDFGFYGLAELGLLMSPVTAQVEKFDNTLYYTNVKDGDKETLSNFTVNFGIGIEKNMDFGYLFGDMKFIIPANQVNGQTVSIQIPASLSLNAGVRIPF